jgi:phosphohistidine phosphatase SixA
MAFQLVRSSYLAPEFACLLTFLAACSSGPPPVAPTPLVASPEVPDLVHELSSGGYVIFFRHAARDAAAISTPDLALADNQAECRPGSELTAAGIADVQSLKRAFEGLGIGVDRVYASPTCRTTQMAALMFARFEVTRALAWPGMWRSAEEPALTTSLRQLLGAPPAPHLNTVLISHNDVLQANRIGVGLTLDQAEAAIFRPLEDGTFQFVGRVLKEQWTIPPWLATGAGER